MGTILRKTKLEELVDFWNVSNFHLKTKIHNQDFDLIENNLIKNCSNSSDFIKNYLSSKNKQNLDKKFHSNLLPEPYCGNLSNAKIFILGLNPGFDNATYFCQENEKLRNALENNLKQNLSEYEYPFIGLNPEFLWTDSGRWCFSKFDQQENSLIREIMNRKNCDYLGSLKFLSQKIASLELVPYHSKLFSLPKSIYMKMPSVKIMLSFIENYVLPKVNSGDAILIVLRKGNILESEIDGLKEIENKIVIYKGSGECQRASLSANSRGGKAILNFLQSEQTESLI